MVLTGYGTGNSVRIEKSPLVQRIADRVGRSPVAVVLRWTVSRGVAVVPRSGDPEHVKENLAAVEDPEFGLTEQELAELDRMNRAHPYYWWPLPLLPAGSPEDLE